MPWRVCRVLDFEKHCTSVHYREDAAKEETANQLLSLLAMLEANIPMYRGYGGYTKHFPGFVEDLEEMIQIVRRRIEDGDTWGAYDDWHRFLQQWNLERMDPPIWAQVGTVIVQGPGPKTVPAYDPTAWTAKNVRHQGKRREAERMEFDFKKSYQEFFENLSKEVILNKLRTSGEALDPRTVVTEVMESAKSIEFDPTKEKDQDWAWRHYFDLIIKDVEHKFGVQLETLPGQSG